MQKVLIVEDEVTVLELVSEILGGPGGYLVFNAQDGQEALNVARREIPDLMLLDVQIPIINGYEVCTTLKTDAATSGIKIIMLTGMVQEADSEKAREAGADGYFTKPFRPAALLAKVDEVMKSHPEVNS